MPNATIPASEPVTVPFEATRQRILAEADALPDLDVRAVDTDTPIFVSGVLDTHEKRQSLGPLFNHHLIPRGALDNVRGYAVVALEEELSQPAPTSPEAEALATGKVMLTHFKTEASVAVARGKIPASAFAEMPHNGYLNDGLALIRYPKVFRDNWEVIASETKVTRADLDAAEAHGHVLVAMAGEREARAAQGAPPVHIDRRTRTFSLLDRAMDELRPIITFLLRSSSDPIELYLPTKPKKKSKAKKTSPGEVKAPVTKKDANAEEPKASGPRANAPTPSANANLQAPKVEEDRAAE